MEKKKIERLYELLERADREHDAEVAAALRWAIFTLESQFETTDSKGCNDKEDTCRGVGCYQCRESRCHHGQDC